MKFIYSTGAIIFFLTMIAIATLLLFPPTGFTPTDFIVPVALLLFVSAVGFSYDLLDKRMKKMTSPYMKALKVTSLAALCTVGAFVVFILIMVLIGYLHSQGLLGDGASYWP